MCESLPGRDPHLCETKTAVSRIKRSEYRPSLNTPRGKHSIDILISSLMQSVILFESIFFLVIPFQRQFSFLCFCYLHAFIRTVEVFGPYFVIDPSLTLCSDSSWSSPVSSACSCLTFVFFVYHLLILPSSMATIFQKEGNPFIPLQVQSIQAPAFCFSSVFPCR